MGRRFLYERYLHAYYSKKRVFFLLNEEGYTPHRRKPYGFESKKFRYRNMFEEHRTRLGKKNARRVAKKAVRQQTKRQLYFY